MEVPVQKFKVAKFGGTSLADAGQIEKVCMIASSDPGRRVIVVSAPGKRAKNDIKVTDMLIACAEDRLAGRPVDAGAEAIVARYREIAMSFHLDTSIVDDMRSDIMARVNSDISDPAAFMDLMKAAGEDNSARLVAAVMRARGMDARYLSPKDAGLTLTPEYGNAVVMPDSYPRLARIREFKGVTVFPGFFGYTPDGRTVTFPRGGSDITGAILAAATNADVYENFTDVDSVYSADPSIVPEAQPMQLLTYREMRELAYAGFGVFHDEAIVPAVKAGIPICIKNTNNPSAPGTMVVPKRERSARTVAGIASAEGFCAVYVDKYLMNREVGFGRRLLQIIEEEGLSYEHAPSGIDNTSVILRERVFTPEKETKVIARIRDELVPDNVEVERGLSLVMIVGEGMHYAVGVAATATAAIASAGVNIEMLNQGSSEISMMFGVKSVDRKKAVQSLYMAFFR